MHDLDYVTIIDIMCGQLLPGQAGVHSWPPVNIPEDTTHKGPLYAQVHTDLPHIKPYEYNISHSWSMNKNNSNFFAYVDLAGSKLDIFFNTNLIIFYYGNLDP